MADEPSDYLNDDDHSWLDQMMKASGRTRPFPPIRPDLTAQRDRIQKELERETDPTLVSLLQKELRRINNT